MINPDVLDLDLVNNDCVSNALVRSATINNILLPNEQFYEIFSQLNESQASVQLQFQISRKNNELPPKPLQIFLSGGAEVRKSFLVTKINGYLKKILRYPNQTFDQPSVLVTASTGTAATKVSMVLHCILYIISLLSGIEILWVKEAK